MTEPELTADDEPRIFRQLAAIDRRLADIEHELASLRREKGGADNRRLDRLEQQLGFKLPPEV